MKFISFYFDAILKINLKPLSDTTVRMWKYEGQGIPQQTKLDRRISQLAKHLDFEFT